MGGGREGTDRPGRGTPPMSHFYFGRLRDLLTIINDYAGNRQLLFAGYRAVA